MPVGIDRELIIALREMHKADIIRRFHDAESVTHGDPNRERMLKGLQRQPICPERSIDIAGRVEARGDVQLIPSDSVELQPTAVEFERGRVLAAVEIHEGDVVG
jgi:hypothetical protein